MNKEQSKQDFHPLVDKAKAEMIKWAHRPKTKQDIRTFASISDRLVFLFASVQSINDYQKQILESPLIINGMPLNVFEEMIKKDPSLDVVESVSIDLDKKLKDEAMESLIEEMLLLSVAADNRAGKLIEMAKQMNRPSFNPMAMLGGLMANSNESQEDLIEEVNYDH